jgi:hypothetical protein
MAMGTRCRCAATAGASESRLPTKNLIVVISILALVGWATSHFFLGDSVTQSTPKSLTPSQVAQVACENWTRTHSKLGVGEIVDSYRIAGAKKPGRVRVRITFRAQGNGLMMSSVCEYQTTGTGVVLVDAHDGVK